MAMQYHAIVIGGGHNGLTTAAYLARAGKKVLVLERRHVLGGAAVTEEVFPGFQFSVCSYVVSLLRPEIIRDLDLPRHGFEVLPLDGTFTPMPDGDHLWRTNDHAPTRPQLPPPPLPPPVPLRPPQPRPAHDTQRGGLPGPVVRNRRPQGHDVGLGHHRDPPRRALPRHRLRPPPPLHGRDRWHVPRLGLRAGGNGGH